ncbi:hypothetical protein [Aureibaculum luteum]|uniref:hypothetical protein n=1 Tax=Aureibaculum luteum TaxID=1548456 RepID=UPI000E548179|nr:hypothetical protein [Aureibaculum luteum]
MKLSVLVIFLFSINIYAQQQGPIPKNYLGIGIGYRLDNLKDTNFSPLNQKGGSFFYSVFYERHSKNIMKFNIKYGDGILKSGRSDRLKTSYYAGSVGFTYLKNLSTNQESANFYVGGSYNLDLLYMDWFNQDAFSYVSAHGLSMNVAVSKQLAPRQYIESTVAIPVLQFLSRPPYNGIDEYIIENQDEPLNIIFAGKLTSLKAYKSIHWNVNYRYEISNNFNLKFDYDLNIQSVKTVNEFKNLSNRVSTSLLYQF